MRRAEDAEAVVADSQPGPEREGAGVRSCAWRWWTRRALPRPPGEPATPRLYGSSPTRLRRAAAGCHDPRPAPVGGLRGDRVADRGAARDRAARTRRWRARRERRRRGRPLGMRHVPADLRSTSTRRRGRHARRPRARPRATPAQIGALGWDARIYAARRRRLALRLERDTAAAARGARSEVERDPTATGGGSGVRDRALVRAVGAARSDDAEGAAAHRRYGRGAAGRDGPAELPAGRRGLPRRGRVAPGDEAAADARRRPRAVRRPAPGLEPPAAAGAARLPGGGCRAASTPRPASTRRGTSSAAR